MLPPKNDALVESAGELREFRVDIDGTGLAECIGDNALVESA
jgi:hypothetical protein